MPTQPTRQRPPRRRPTRAPTYHCSICDEAWDIRFIDTVHRYCAVINADGSRESGRPVRD